MIDKKKVCIHCNKQINLNEDKHVLLGTYDGELILNETYFHQSCFNEWYNKKVSEKARNMVKTVQSKAMDLFSGVQKLVGTGGDKGFSKLGGMIGLDLEKNKKEEEEKTVLGEKPNGKGKRSAKK